MQLLIFSVHRYCTRGEHRFGCLVCVWVSVKNFILEVLGYGLKAILRAIPEVAVYRVFNFPVRASNLIPRIVIKRCSTYVSNDSRNVSKSPLRPQNSPLSLSSLFRQSTYSLVGYGIVFTPTSQQESQLAQTSSFACRSPPLIFSRRPSFPYL